MNTPNQNTALRVMDMQAGITRSQPAGSEIIGNVAKTIAHARANNIPMIFVIVGFRAGLPEVSPNNKSFSASKARMRAGNMDEFMKIDEAVAPLPNEVIVT